MPDKTDTIKKRKEKLIEKRKKRFLEGLVKYRGNVLITCMNLKMNRSYLYELKDDDDKFSEQWEEAVEEGHVLLGEEAESALRTGIIKKQNPSLIIFALKNLKAKRWKDIQTHEGKVIHKVKVPRKEARSYAKKILELTGGIGKENSKRNKRTKDNLPKSRKES